MAVVFKNYVLHVHVCNQVLANKLLISFILLQSFTREHELKVICFPHVLQLHNLFSLKAGKVQD